MQLTFFNMKPPYNSSLLNTLTNGINVIVIQELGAHTFKAWSTKREVIATDVQGIYILESIDKNNESHYLIISALDLLTEKKYDNYEQAYLITPLVEVDSKDVKVIDEYIVEVNDDAVGDYLNDFIKVK